MGGPNLGRKSRALDSAGVISQAQAQPPTGCVTFKGNLLNISMPWSSLRNSKNSGNCTLGKLSDIMGLTQPSCNNQETSYQKSNGIAHWLRLLA